MIAYFDTSGLVKLLVEEPGSDTAAAAWRAADVRVCCTVGFAEAAVLHGLRGYDATHLAAASEAAAVVVAADGALLRAASASGLATIDAGS